MKLFLNEFLGRQMTNFFEHSFFNPLTPGSETKWKTICLGLILLKTSPVLSSQNNVAVICNIYFFFLRECSCKKLRKIS